MAWWTTVPGLTPVAAYDANRFSGAQLLDGVGVNHITATSALLPYTFLWKSVAGNSNPMTFATPIPMPATGVVAGFWSPRRRNVFLSPSQNTALGYALHLNDSGLGWLTSSGSYGSYGAYGSIGNMYFVAMVTRGSDSILYVDGNLVGVPVSSSFTMSQIGQLGHGANGSEYNLDADEYFHALGVWTGAATQGDLQALEAAVRLELVGGSATYRGFQPPEGRLSSSPVEALDAIGVRRIDRAQVQGNRSIYFAGNGRITGTVKEKGAASNTPVHRRVVLMDERTSLMVQEQWSDAATGVYSFINVDSTRTFTVLSYDHTGAFRAVVADRIVPELIP